MDNLNSLKENQELLVEIEFCIMTLKTILDDDPSKIDNLFKENEIYVFRRHIETSKECVEYFYFKKDFKKEIKNKVNSSNILLIEDRDVRNELEKVCSLIEGFDFNDYKEFLNNYTNLITDIDSIKKQN